MRICLLPWAVRTGQIVLSIGTVRLDTALVSHLYITSCNVGIIVIQRTLEITTVFVTKDFAVNSNLLL